MAQAHGQGDRWRPRSHARRQPWCCCSTVTAALLHAPLVASLCLTGRALLAAAARPRLLAGSARQPRPELHRRDTVRVVALPAVWSALFAGAGSGTADGQTSLPVDELCDLHRFFGGDSSLQDNSPMQQRAPSGGTISALSVQIPALERLAPFLRGRGARALDLGFGSGVMTAMMLAIAGDDAHVVGVDLQDKVPVAAANLLGGGEEKIPFLPFSEKQFTLIGGDAFEQLAAWRRSGTTFDVLYSGCSMNPDTDQLGLFLAPLMPDGAAVFNLGNPGQQGMYFVAHEGRICEQLMQVNFMMCDSPFTPRISKMRVPLQPEKLCAWIRTNIFGAVGREL